LAFGSLKGFQLGFLNIAGKVKGTQIGFVNLSDEYESGVPIGLINISRKGGFEGEAWVEETGFAFVGMRFGPRWMHSQLAVGTRPADTRQILAPTLGMAGEFDLGNSPLYLEAGLLHSTLFSVHETARTDKGVDSDWTRVRAGLGWQILPYTRVARRFSYHVA